MYKNHFLSTDILPFEIPSLFSNAQLYKSPDFTEKRLRQIINYKVTQKADYKTEVEWIQNNLKFAKKSKPLYFKNQVSKSKSRKMSLLHPVSQVRALYFILEFEDEILSHMDSNFSFRLPIKRNEDIIVEEDKANFEMESVITAFDPKTGIFSEDDKDTFRHYFSYSRVSSFKELVTHPKVRVAQSRFQFSKKIDLQNFFPSIYTHSLAWALLGSKSVAKEFRKDNNKWDYFENKTDTLMTEINFDETNGIVVGPEFSRIIAELLLVRIDKMVESELWKGYRLRNNSDYAIFRFVDDIFIFSNSTVVNSNIQNAYANALQKFNLSLNESKIKDFSDSENIFYSKVAELQKLFWIFTTHRSHEFFRLKEKGVLSLNEKADSFLGIAANWDVFFKNLLKIILDTSERKDIMVNYALSTILSLLKFSKISPEQLMSILSGITSILKINLCFKSIHYFILLVSQIVTQLDKKIDQKFQFEKAFGMGINIEDRDVEKISIVFHHLVQIFNSSWFNVSEGYELVSFMEFFKKYNLFIPSQTLHSFIKEQNLENDYFVLTTVTNYIYDPKSRNIFKEYKSVYATVCTCLFRKLHFYSYEGINETNNGNFFYLINDFYYFPGKPELFKIKLEKEFKESVVKILTSPLSKESYFQWGKDFDFFLKNVIKKKLINKHINLTELTSI